MKSSGHFRRQVARQCSSSDGGGAKQSRNARTHTQAHTLSSEGVLFSERKVRQAGRVVGKSVATLPGGGVCLCSSGYAVCVCVSVGGVEYAAAARSQPASKAAGNE